MNEIDWTTAVVVLAVGLAAGLAIAFRVRGAASRGRPEVETGPAERERRETEGRLDALVQQLRDMDGRSPDTPERAQERYALEIEAARQLLALEAAAPPVRRAHGPARGPSAPEAPAGTPELRERRAAQRGFAWGFASAAALGLLFAFVVRDVQPRAEGESVTGNLPEMGGAGRAGGGADPEEAQLRARVEANPNDVDARMELARLYLSGQDLMGVFNETQAVLAAEPGHAEAMSLQALVRLAMGQGQAALGLLRDALARDPEMLEGYLHLMLVETRLGDTAGAERTMAEAVRRFPAHREDIERVMGEIRRVGQGAPDATGPAAAEAHEGVPPPASAAVAGTVELQGAVPDTALLFITVRAEGVDSGPPVAVQRLPARFPVRFAITAADSMMGQELPARMRVEARVDPDGDPLTRSPQDPSARADGVALGTRDLRLVLR